MITDEQLCAFGVGFDDDGYHPFDPDDDSWNESWFWDWYDESGALAGHCRFGTMPGVGRAWVWCYQRWGDAWLVVDQPWLELAQAPRPEIGIELDGLECRYRIDDPLRAGHLRVRAPARVVGGADDGRVVPLVVDLDVRSVGAAHSTGPGAVPGHEADGYDARRYEQPIAVAGTITVDGRQTSLEGRGERDHSWGPRVWQLEWSFLVLNGEDRRLMCVEVRFEGGESLAIGYLQDEASTHDLADVSLVVMRYPSLDEPIIAAVSVVAGDGVAFNASIESIATHEMDLSHVLPPGTPSTYRRSLVRARPLGGVAPMLGWLEEHVLDRQPLAARP